MTSRSRVLILITSTVAVMTVLVLLVIFGRFLREEKSAGHLIDSIAKADDAIANGYYDRASSILEGASSLANSSAEWLRLLKRAHSVGERTGSYKPFTQIALSARKKFPHRQDIAACAAYGMMRSGMAHAEELVGAVDTLGKQFDSVSAEALLRRGSPLTQSEQIPGYFGEFVRTVQNEDPEELSRLAGLEHDPRLYLDTALLLMERGEVEKAFSFVKRRDVESMFPEAAMAIAYDAGEFDHAADIYLGTFLSPDKPPDLILFGCDVLLAAGRTETAGDEYRRFVEKYPDHSWIPYYNLSIASEDVETASAVIMKGIEQFPANEWLVVRNAILVNQNGAGRSEALEMLNDLRNANGFGQAAALTVLKLSQGALSRRRFEAELWRLFNAETVIEETARYLAWYLSGIGDIESLRIVVERASQLFEEGWWIDFYRAIEAFQRGARTDAYGYFTSAGAKGGPWQIEYNLGILRLSEGDHAIAARHMRNALSMAGKGSKEGIDPRTESRILTGLAYSLLAGGDREGALREIRYALELDPENLQGSILLQKAVLQENGT